MLCVLRAARVTETGPWEQEDISATLEKITALRHSLGSGCFCAACKSQGLGSLTVLLRCVPAGQECHMPGASLSAPRHCRLSNMGSSLILGAALLSDPCFATWLLRIGVTTESFLREICCLVHQEFWLGVSSNAGLNNKLKVLNNLRPCFDSFPKVIPQILWLRYRRFLEQVLCFKPQSW